MDLLIYNNFDFNLHFPFYILERCKEFLEHPELELILLKAHYFLNDFYRSYLCVCFPPNELAASALFMTLLYLKFDLTKKNISKVEVREMMKEEEQFPW